MNSLLSIGQFSKLCNTSKDTLIHYDEIGLLHPCKIGENHYRLYSVSQCQIFHIIRLFAEHNVPLPEIKKLCKENSIDIIHQSLIQKRNELLRQKQYLEGAILHLDDIKQLHSFAFSEQSSDPIIVKQNFPLDFFVTKVPYPNTTPKQLNQALEDHFIHCYQKGLYPFPITYIIKKESLFARNYIPYLIASPNGSGCTDNHTYRKPEISYVVISHNGSYESIEYTLEKALNFIKNKKLCILGNFYISDFSNCIPNGRSTLYIIQIAVKEC